MTRGSRSRHAPRVTTHAIAVQPPYRLDLTVTALRRTATNVVDVYTPDGHCLRALDGRTGPVIVSVTQPRRNALSVAVKGNASEATRALASVRRMLGTERDLSSFHRHARTVAWLAPLARRLRGIRPPRYPTLFAALRRAAEAIASGALSEAMLEEQSSDEAGVMLQGIKGIGPWTAAVILLRGLGWIDVFPGKDSGVATNATLVAGRPVNVERLVEQLGPQRGMLYFCLLLARLDARGEIGRASDVAS